MHPMTARNRVRCTSALLALLVAGAAVTSAVVQAQGTPAGVPSPEKFFGFQMGADRKLANWGRLVEYYQTLAKGSKNMWLTELGKSSEGRPYLAIFISSPDN